MEDQLIGLSGVRVPALSIRAVTFGGGQGAIYSCAFLRVGSSL